MIHRRWQGTGEAIRVDPVDRIPDFDPRSGDHLWTIGTLYRVVPEQWSDPTATPMLDSENLLTVAGPVCFHCERIYTQQLAQRRCKGKP